MKNRGELKKQLEFALAHPEEISKVAAVQSQVREGGDGRMRAVCALFPFGRPLGRCSVAHPAKRSTDPTEAQLLYDYRCRSLLPAPIVSPLCLAFPSWSGSVSAGTFFFEP